MPPEQTIRLIRAQDLTIKASMSPPRDITGWTLKFEVKDAIGGSSTVSKTTSSGITITDAGRGIISIALAKADTSAVTVSSGLAAGKGYVWEIRRTDSGSTTVLARGQLILEQEVIT